MSQRSFLCRLLLLCTLLLPGPAFAGPTISIVKSGASSFTVNGSGLQGVGGIQLEISYDSSRLSEPVVVNGGLVSGAILQSNPKNPITIAVIHATGISGSGVIATINFKLIGDSTGNLIVTRSMVIDAAGKTLMAQVSGYTDSGVGNQNTASGNSDNASGSTNLAGGTTTTTPGTTGSGTTTVGGTITMATEDSAKEQPKAQPEAQPEPAPAVAASEPPPAPAEAREEAAPRKSAEPTKRQALQSILERFRLYQGERTPKKLIALFDRGDLSSFTQEPPIAISDGEQVVTVTIRNVTVKDAPNFAFNSARHVSVQQIAEGEWQVQVKPDKDAVNASISMLADGVMREFPLTVAPKARVDLVKAGTVTDADFELFLKERAKHDLNADGKRDYIDDYIYTANYLLAKDKVAKKK